MRTLLWVSVFAGLFSFTLAGCGGSTEPTIVEVAPESNGVPTDQMEEYKKSMESGGSQRPGN